MSMMAKPLDEMMMSVQADGTVKRHVGFRPLITAAALGLALLHLVTATMLATRPFAWEISNLTLLAAYILAAVVCWERGYRSQGFFRRSWFLICTSAVLWCVGQALYMMHYCVANGPLSTNSPVDLAFYAFYLPLAVCLFVDGEEDFRFDWVRAMDFAQLGVVVSFVYLHFFVFMASSAETRQEVLQWRVYEYSNAVILMASLYRTLAARGRAQRRFLLCLTAVFAIYTVVDALFNYGISPQMDLWADLAYGLPALALAVTAAGWEGPTEAPVQDEGSARPAEYLRQMLPTIAPLVVLGLAHTTSRGSSTLMFLAMAASFLCSSIRLVLIHRQQRKALQSLRASELRFSKAFHSNPTAMTISRLRDGLYRDVNERWLQVSHITRERMIGHTAQDLGIWHDIADRERFVRRLKQQGSVANFETSFHLGSLGLRSVLISAEVLHLEGEPHVLASVQDITESKAAESELKRSLSVLQATLDSTADGILVCDLEGQVVNLNHGLVEMWRLPGETLRRRDARTFLQFAMDQVKDAAAFRKTVAAMAASPNGESFDLVELKDGRILERYSRPQRMDGVAVGRVWNFRDISVRHNLEQQLRQAQKMEAIGTLAGGVAHDFNNLLSVILGYSEFLQHRLGNDAEVKADVEQITGAAERAAALTRQLLAFSRRQVLQPRSLNLTDVVSGLEGMLSRLIGANIQINARYGTGLGIVQADAGQIEQVVMNLVVNSRDAMPEGGEITLETANVELDAGFAARHKGCLPGSYVCLSVTDTGIGMNAETKARIFEPFFTTKELGRGTGLGLATVYGIVKQSGGYIQVESEVGHGTSFHIYLPRVWQKAESAVAEAPPKIAGRNETILLVEDDEAVRELSQRALENAGFTVLAAPHGEAGLAFCSQQCPVQLVVTDLCMPGISGRELQKRLLGLHPGLRTLFITGYADADFQDSLLQSGIPWLNKPFSPTELVRKVCEVLQEPGAEAIARGTGVLI